MSGLQNTIPRGKAVHSSMGHPGQKCRKDYFMSKPCFLAPQDIPSASISLFIF